MSSVKVSLISVSVEPNPTVRMTPAGPVNSQPTSSPPKMFNMNFLIHVETGNVNINNQSGLHGVPGVNLSVRVPGEHGLDHGEKEARRQIAEFAQQLAEATRQS